MTTYWNFRQILNIYPESDGFTCVAARGDESTRCPNKRPLLSDLDLAEAGKLLDSMDNCENLKASYEYLLDLAHLTLCVEHSESGLRQIAQISGRWQDKIILHMKKEVASTARPKTRRPAFGRQRGPSQHLMGVLIETREEQMQSPAIRTSINVPSLDTRKGSKKTPRPKPTRSVSNKINSLITDSGFQDSANEQYKPYNPLKHSKTVSQAPSGAGIPRFLRVGSKKATSKDTAWANTQLQTLLADTDGRLDLEETPTSATRERSSTTSSTGSTATSSSKASKFTESLDGASSQSSRDSSAKTSPEIGSTSRPLKSFSSQDGLKLSPPDIRVAPVPSPERPLPTFDFGIFTNLPLPPGHKEELSPQDAQFPDEWESEYKVPRLPLPPQKFDFNSTANTRPSQLMEKPARSSTKAGKKSIAKRASKVPIARKEVSSYSAAAMHYDQEVESEIAPKPTAQQLKKMQSVGSLAEMPIRESSPPPPNPLLPETSTTDPIGTSWMSPLMRQPSKKNSVKLARRPSRLSRTFSRSSKRSSKVASIAEDYPSEHSPERKLMMRRQTELARPLSTKRETLPLDTLIAMSHELADRLDGIESGRGFVEVRSSSSYKYHLPRPSTAKDTPPMPDLRWSKLFTAVEPEAFLNESPFFRKTPEKVPTRSKSVPNVGQDEELKMQHPGNEVSLPLSEMKIKAVREEVFPALEHPRAAPAPIREVEVCGVCGNTQGIWGRCGCVVEQSRFSGTTTMTGGGGLGSGRGSMYSRFPAPMEQAPPLPKRNTLRRIRKRAGTLRRIRTRVVRALTV